VSGLPPLLLFHFFARRPLPASLIAGSLLPIFEPYDAQQDADRAITGHVYEQRKHKLGAKRE